MKSKVLIGAVLAALLGGASFFFFSSPAGDETKPTRSSLTSKKKHVRQPMKKKTRETSMVIPVKGREAAYKVNLEKDEEGKLTDAYRKLLAELRDVLDPLDKKRLLVLVKRMQSSDEWPDGIPSILHMAAIEALGELGSDGAAELAGYLGSGDEDVREEAMDAIIDSVDDDTLSDREKSEMIKVFAQTLTDGDALESLFDIIDMDMRNSVQIDTIRDVLENGTAEAKRKILEETLPEVIDREDAISMEEAEQAMENWLAENPDEADDDETFAGTKDDADDKEGDEEDVVQDQNP